MVRDKKGQLMLLRVTKSCASWGGFLHLSSFVRLVGPTEDGDQTIASVGF